MLLWMSLSEFSGQESQEKNKRLVILIFHHDYSPVMQYFLIVLIQFIKKLKVLFRYNPITNRMEELNSWDPGSTPRRCTFFLHSSLDCFLLAKIWLGVRFNFGIVRTNAELNLQHQLQCTFLNLSITRPFFLNRTTFCLSVLNSTIAPMGFQEEHTGTERKISDCS